MARVFAILISKMPQRGVILGETGDPESLLPMAVMNAVQLKSPSGSPPSARMTALGMAPLRHLANQVCDFGLLHRHALGQIPRLVHVGATRRRGVIREQLQRYDVQDGREHAVVFGQSNHMQSLA